MSKWKDRKQHSRQRAIAKKLTRGRQSGATNKETEHQKRLIDFGYSRYDILFTYLMRTHYA